MSNWQSKIAGTFGVSDLIFAGHPADEDRAFELLCSVREQKVGWSAVKAEATKFLKSKNASDQHISRQIEKMKSSMAFWLLD